MLQSILIVRCRAQNASSCRNTRVLVGHEDQPLRLGRSKRVKQKRVDAGRNHSVPAETDGEHQDGSDRVSEVVSERT
jgi:hypothetical protein